jgi:hypothetical protein
MISSDANNALLAKHALTYNSREQVTSATVTDPVTNATRTLTNVYCEPADVTAGNCPQVGLLRRVDGPRTDVNDLRDYAACAQNLYRATTRSDSFLARLCMHESLNTSQANGVISRPGFSRVFRGRAYLL